MKYTQPSFTLPTVTAKISQEEYEIRVGLRCDKCRGLRPGCRCAPKSIADYVNFVITEESGPMSEAAALDFECCGCEGCGFDCGCLCS